MNAHILTLINGWARKNTLLDNFMIFCAKDLVYVAFMVASGGVGYLIYKRQWKPVAYFIATLAVTFILL
jgi:hypothetical protein